MAEAEHQLETDPGRAEPQGVERSASAGPAIFNRLRPNSIA